MSSFKKGDRVHCSGYFFASNEQAIPRQIYEVLSGEADSDDDILVQDINKYNCPRYIHVSQCTLVDKAVTEPKLEDPLQFMKDRISTLKSEGHGEETAVIRQLRYIIRRCFGLEQRMIEQWVPINNQ